MKKLHDLEKEQAAPVVKDEKLEQVTGGGGIESSNVVGCLPQNKKQKLNEVKLEKAGSGKVFNDWNYVDIE